MRNLFIFSSILMLAAGTGCKKFLDRQPASSFTEDSYYKNTSEVETGVIGCYAALRNVYKDDPVLVGLRSDDSYIAESDGDINLIDAFGEGPTNSYLSQYWQDAYYVIKQCNTVLKYIGNVGDTTQRRYFEGEVRFLRAHMYFNLVRLWGPVPLVTSDVAYNDTAYYRRRDSATVYQQIITDFNIAAQQLPASWDVTEIARVTNYAAKGMLAKVYLTQKNYAASRPLLQDLMDNPGPYALQASYKTVFGLRNEMNNEIMYAVRYKGNFNGMGQNFTYNMDKAPGSVGYRSSGDYRGTSLWPAADSIRKSSTFSTGGKYGSDYYDVAKYQDSTAPKNDAGADFVVLRYADIVLMYAEVVNEMDGAPTSDLSPSLVALNKIRRRAQPSGTLVYLYNNTAVKTQDAFRSTIKAERRREFGMEDQRWFDLLRWNDAVSAMNTHFSYRNANVTVKAYQVLYPVPQREIDLSGGIITQNPGY
ncbi:MAG: RagB/SusD family nutrient uptake outer membrane protein [Bacteroidetes bacterium]|nr:RagB/SusD family nutrient uptake outer membrane protein [Bacteroidota bacterium]